MDFDLLKKTMEISNILNGVEELDNIHDSIFSDEESNKATEKSRKKKYSIIEEIKDAIEEVKTCRKNNNLEYEQAVTGMLMSLDYRKYNNAHKIYWKLKKELSKKEEKAEINLKKVLNSKITDNIYTNYAFIKAKNNNEIDHFEQLNKKFFTNKENFKEHISIFKSGVIELIYEYILGEKSKEAIYELVREIEKNYSIRLFYEFVEIVENKKEKTAQEQAEALETKRKEVCKEYNILKTQINNINDLVNELSKPIYADSKEAKDTIIRLNEIAVNFSDYEKLLVIMADNEIFNKKCSLIEEVSKKCRDTVIIAAIEKDLALANNDYIYKDRKISNEMTKLESKVGSFRSLANEVELFTKVDYLKKQGIELTKERRELETKKREVTIVNNTDEEVEKFREYEERVININRSENENAELLSKFEEARRNATEQNIISGKGKKL